jgi:catechol 2,3-dioxygenase-like lactoylglutathione lyase family enzyme
MLRHSVAGIIAAVLLLAETAPRTAAQQPPSVLGVFEGQSDVGSAVSGDAASGGAVRAPKSAAAARPPITAVSHIAIYASDLGQSERFYVHDLGGVKGDDPENPVGVRYYFALTQFVEVLPLPPGARSINRLDHVAFVTQDAQALREYLKSKKIAVPPLLQGRDGSRWFDVIDPEGNKIEFVQPALDPPRVAVNPLSSHIIHVGFIIHNRTTEDAFFRELLGFRPYWFGGMKDDVPTWVSQQVPDGTDWLEYMIVGTPEGRGIPSTMSAADLGVLDHFSLGVSNVQAAYTLLWNGDRLAGQTNVPKIGRDAKWQLNLSDPDGTRAEVMEFHAIGTPCCSPFTAADPQE